MLNKNPTILPAIIGNILEFFDVGLYGFLAPIIAIHFFPLSDPLSLMLAATGVFAAGFVARPIGAMVFGHIGDKYGRKMVLMLTLFLMAPATLLLGMLPTYEQIGLWAPILLTFIRLLQGICTGGEYNSAAIYILEHTPDNKKGLYSGIVTATSILGFFLASVCSKLISLDFMPEWGWRIPFWIGALIAFAGYMLRRKALETPEFVKLTKTRKISRYPLISSFRKSPKAMLATLSVGWLAGALSLSIIGFMQSFLTTIVKLPQDHIFLISQISIVIYMVSLPFFGRISDYLDYRRVMGCAALISAVTSFPIFFLLLSGLYFNIACGLITLSLLAGAFLGPMHAFMFSSFPPEQRCSGISLSFSIGVALFGGTAPMISTYLIQVTHYAYSPAFYFFISSVVGMFAVTMWQNKSVTLARN